MILRKSFCGVIFCVALTLSANIVFGQVYSRPRIVPPNPPIAAPQKTSQPTVKTTVSQRPILTNEINVVTPTQSQPPQYVKKIADIRPLLPMVTEYLKGSTYGAEMTGQMFNSISAKLGIRYVYGTEGPNTYDCSGFVWSVFKSAGIYFERTSAKSLWHMSLPVAENEKFKFGTLVFFNKLGHMGIVADANGFYHASSSKGITYSPFAGYWAKRIVGFRRFPVPADQ